VLSDGKLAHFPDGRGSHALARRSLRDPVTQLRGRVCAEFQVEPAQYRPVIGHQHVVRAYALVLIGQETGEPLRELAEELIAAVGDGRGEVSPVRQFEGQHGRGVVGAQALQLGHPVRIPGVPRRRLDGL